MTQSLQTKSGVVAFIATVQMVVEGVEIAKKGDGFVAIQNGVELGAIIGEQVKYIGEEDKVSKVKLTSLVPGIDPATLVGKNFAEMTPAEQAAYVKYLEGLASDKIGAPATPAKAEKAAKPAAEKTEKAAPAAAEGDKIAIPATLAELKKIGVKELVKLAKQEGVEGITSRTPKTEVEEKLAAAFGLTEEAAPAKEKGKGKKSEVLKSDEELDEEESDDDEDEDEDEDEDSDDDDSDDDSDEDEDEDEDSDDEDEDEDEDSDEDDDDEDEDEDEEDEEEDALAKLKKKWTPEKVDALTTKDEINALRKAVGVSYSAGEKVSPVRVKEDIKIKLFGKGKKK